MNPDPFQLLQRMCQSGLLWLLLLSNSAQAAGLLQAVDQQYQSLELKTHDVVVSVENGYVTTQITQTFYNPNAHNLEARYVFPVPHKAAVGEFTYWIAGQPVTGEVVEKAKARKIYKTEKQAGRNAALVEQDATKTFNVSVTPVPARDEVRIQLVYLQRAEIDTSIGRYVYPLENGGVDTAERSFWAFNETVKERFTFTLHLKSAYPIDSIRLPEHPHATIAQRSGHEWTITLNQTTPPVKKLYEGERKPLTLSEINARNKVPEGRLKDTSVPGLKMYDRQSQATLNKDIVVYWRLKQGLPGAVDIVTHKAPNQAAGTFMLTLTPGEDLTRITEGRDWIFVLDYSGSMQGKYNSMIEGIRRGLAQLRAEDRFRVVTFNNESKHITRKPLPATPENVQRVLTQLENITPNGGTNLYAGLEKGLGILNADRSSAIILVTDGEANVGVTHKREFFDLLAHYDARLFTFVMGNSANKPLLEGMSQLSNGFAIRVSNSDDIIGRLMETTSRLTHEALHDISLDIDGVEVFDVTPKRIGSLYRGQQLTVLGRYRQPGPANIILKAKISGQAKTFKTQVEFRATNTAHPELERLWAFAKIDHLLSTLDYLGKNADTEQAITDLAIAYGLVTDYTSMITVSEDLFATYKIERRNKKRIAREHQARQKRQANPTHQHANHTQPMFNGPRASHSGGGGTLNYWTVLGLLSCVGLKRKSANYLRGSSPSA